MTAPRARLTPFAIPLHRPLRAGAAVLTVRHGLLLELRDGDGRLALGEAVSTAAQPPDWRCEPALRAALESAFADLAAQRAGVPLFRHLGGGASDLAVNGLLDADAPEACAAQAAAMAATGLRCLKLKLDRRDPTAAVRRVAAVRAAVGSGVALRADGNAAWTLDDAVALLHELEPYDLEYVEQPVARLDELAALRRAVGVPIAADESVTGPDAVARIAAAGAADVVVLKPARLGPRRTLAAAAVARAHGLGVVVTSNLESGIGIAAAAHLAIAAGIERPCGLATAALLAGDLASPAPAIDGGRLRLADAPGLGVGLDHAALERWRSGPTVALSDLLATRPATQPSRVGLEGAAPAAPVEEDTADRRYPYQQAPRERRPPGRGGTARPWLERRAASHGAHPALCGGGVQLDFAGLQARVARTAGRLRGLGIGVGDRVALLLGVGVEWVELLHALTRIGAVAVPLGPRLTAAEIAALLDACPCVAVLHDAGGAATIAGLPPVLAGRRIAVDELAALPVAGDARPAWPDLDAPHSVVFTSGSSGAPRPIVLAAGNHLWSALASASVLGVRDDDRWLACLPLHHVGGLSILMRSVVLGIPVELHERFDPKRVNAAIDGGATLVSLVAAMLQRVLEARGGRPFPPHLRAILLGGGPAPRALLDACAAAGVPLAPTYGMTEAASQLATAAPGEAGGDGAAWPLPGVELRLASGAIEVRGPMISRGATGGDGWLRTRDLGALDAAGRLQILGRADDLIISGGENVHPREVERVLEAHPAVAEACAFALPDADWGEVVAAQVRLAAGGAADLDALRRHARVALAGFKQPRRLEIVADFPRSAAGKILRRAVAAQARGSG